MNSQEPTTARMERWRLRLMPYEMTLVYNPGWNELNPARYISRHPQTIPKRENAGEACIPYVTRNAIPKSMTTEEVKNATKKDKTLQSLMLALQTGHWEDPEISNFTRFRELSVHDGLVLRGNRFIIPATLQQNVVAIAYHTHQGIVKTKQCIREKVWFHAIDKLVEDAVKSCIPCQAPHPGTAQREPLQPTPLPSQPWSSLAISTMEFTCHLNHGVHLPSQPWSSLAISTMEFTCHLNHGVHLPSQPWSSLAISTMEFTCHLNHEFPCHLNHGVHLPSQPWSSLAISTMEFTCHLNHEFPCHLNHGVHLPSQPWSSLAISTMEFTCHLNHGVHLPLTLLVRSHQVIICLLS